MKKAVALSAMDQRVLPTDSLSSDAQPRREPSALEAAYQAYYAPLVGFLRKRLPEQSAAEDIAQSVFTKFAIHSERTRIDNPKSYLFQAAKNLVIDNHRARARQHDAVEKHGIDLLLNGNAAPCPEGEAIKQDKLVHLRAIIERMPKNRRTAFLLSRFQEFSDAEVAARMGISLYSVQHHIARAMRTCQLEMIRIYGAPAGKMKEKRKLNGRNSHQF